MTLGQGSNANNFLPAVFVKEFKAFKWLKRLKGSVLVFLGKETFK